MSKSSGSGLVFVLWCPVRNRCPVPQKKKKRRKLTVTLVLFEQPKFMLKLVGNYSSTCIFRANYSVWMCYLFACLMGRMCVLGSSFVFFLEGPNFHFWLVLSWQTDFRVHSVKFCLVNFKNSKYAILVCGIFLGNCVFSDCSCLTKM